MNATALTLSVDSVDDAVAPYVHQRALRPMGATDLRVRLAFVGICGTDVEILHGRMPATFEINYPHSLGHEWSGVVEDVGAVAGRVFRRAVGRDLVDRLEAAASWCVCGPGEHGSPTTSSRRPNTPEVFALCDLVTSPRHRTVHRFDQGVRAAGRPLVSRPIPVRATSRTPSASGGEPLRADAHRLDRTYHPRPPPAQPVPCGPCQIAGLPRSHHRCMTELKPDAVFRASARILGAAPGRPYPCSTALILRLPCASNADRRQESGERRCPSGS